MNDGLRQNRWAGALLFATTSILVLWPLTFHRLGDEAPYPLLLLWIVGALVTAAGYFLPSGFTLPFGFPVFLSVGSGFFIGSVVDTTIDQSEIEQILQVVNYDKATSLAFLGLGFGVIVGLFSVAAWHLATRHRQPVSMFSGLVLLGRTVLWFVPILGAFLAGLESLINLFPGFGIQVMALVQRIF